MRRFEIIDGSRRGGRPCAWLICHEREERFEIELAGNATACDVPAMLMPFVQKGQRTIGHDWAIRWVRERIVPPSRQNLGQVLRANGMSVYDELQLIISSQGRCSQDDFFIREVADEPVQRGPAVRLGRELSALRAEHGLTQRALSDITGVDQAVISRIENGRENPSVSLLSELCHALGAELRLVKREG